MQLERGGGGGGKRAGCPRGEIGLWDTAGCCSRFLREFDRSDRDPASSVAQLRDFAQTLRKLFIDGWIMVDPAAGSAEAPAASRGPGEAGLLGEGKTITQIVFEQFADMTEIRYGSKVKVLWNQTSRRECDASLREMGQIVEDALQRLYVDFGENDLYMAFEAMDMTTWHKALHESHDAAAAAAKLTALRVKTRRLCTAVGTPCSFTEWCLAVRWVLKVRRRRTDADSVDNRVVWVEALAASQGGPSAEHMERLRPLILFYVTITDGTGNVERLLGSHACFLEHHTGGPDGEMAEACLEIAKEAPSTEAEMFRKDGPTLMFTPFSRRCAQLWRALYGRRFACYKKRVDAGKKATGWRLRGSMKAVGLLHKRATSTLMKLAAREGEAAAQTADQTTIVGVGRRDLMRRVHKQDAAAPGKRMLDFRKTTQQRKALKSQVKTWCGFGRKAPKLRCKPGERIGRMVAAPHVPAKPRVGGKFLGARGPPAASQEKRKRAQRMAAGENDDNSAKAPRVKVESLVDLEATELTSDALKAWFPIVAYGQVAEAQAGNGEKRTQKHQPAISTPTKVAFSDDFTRKHRTLRKMFKAAISFKGSKWQETKAADPGCALISGLRECQAFLRKARQFPTLSGVRATYLDKPVLHRGGLSRFGRAVAAS